MELMIKCPDCWESDLTFRHDGIQFNKDNEPIATLHVKCNECDYCEDIEVDTGTYNTFINDIDFIIKTYYLSNEEGEVDKIQDFCLESAINYFRDNYEGEYTIETIGLEVKIKF